MIRCVLTNGIDEKILRTLNLQFLAFAQYGLFFLSWKSSSNAQIALGNYPFPYLTLFIYKARGLQVLLRYSLSIFWLTQRNAISAEVYRCGSKNRYEHPLGSLQGCFLYYLSSPTHHQTKSHAANTQLN